MSVKTRCIKLSAKLANLHFRKIRGWVEKKKTSTHANKCVPAQHAIIVITWGTMVAERLSSVARAEANY